MNQAFINGFIKRAEEHTNGAPTKEETSSFRGRALAEIALRQGIRSHFHELKGKELPSGEKFPGMFSGRLMLNPEEREMLQNYAAQHIVGDLADRGSRSLVSDSLAGAGAGGLVGAVAGGPTTVLPGMGIGAALAFGKNLQHKKIQRTVTQKDIEKMLARLEGVSMLERAIPLSHAYRAATPVK